MPPAQAHGNGPPQTCRHAAPEPVLCDFTLDGPLADGFVFSDQVGAAGCLRVRGATVAGSQQVSVESIATTLGWAATVSDNRGKVVEVLFSDAATGARAEAKVEPGKTVIR